MNNYRLVEIKNEIHQRIKLLSFSKNVKMKELATAICKYCLDDENIMEEILKKLTN